MLAEILNHQIQDTIFSILFVLVVIAIPFASYFYAKKVNPLPYKKLGKKEQNERSVLYARVNGFLILPFFILLIASIWWQFKYLFLLTFFAWLFVSIFYASYRYREGIKQRVKKKYPEFQNFGEDYQTVIPDIEVENLFRKLRYKGAIALVAYIFALSLPVIFIVYTALSKRAQQDNYLVLEISFLIGIAALLMFFIFTWFSLEEMKLSLLNSDTTTVFYCSKCSKTNKFKINNLKSAKEVFVLSKALPKAIFVATTLNTKKLNVECKNCDNIIYNKKK